MADERARERLESQIYPVTYYPRAFADDSVSTEMAGQLELDRVNLPANSHPSISEQAGFISRIV